METEPVVSLRNRSVIPLVVLLAGLGLSGAPLPAAEETTPAQSTEATPAVEEKADTEAKEEAEEKAEVDPAELRNWVNVSMGGVFLNGDKAQFMQRHRMPRGAFGGIEGFHYEKEVGKDGTFKLDGRGLFDLHDYQLKLDVTFPEKGFVRAGYQEVRSWYDGSAGFLPQGNTWISLYDENLYVDRGEAWFEAGLTLPDLPILTFRYSHQFRRGTKDSTLWGDHFQPGSPLGSELRGVVPSFLELDEQRDIFELQGTHTIKKTTLGLGLRYEISQIDNALKLHRRPGEALADRYVTSRNGSDSDLFSVHGTSSTRFNDKVLFTAGASFTAMDNDFTGQRFYGAGYDLAYDLTTLGRRQFGDQGYTNLVGGSRLQEYVLNVNLMYNPWEYVSVVPSIRVQKQDQDSSSSYLDTMDLGPLPSVASTANSDRGLLSVSERLDLRYTAITNWLFYGRAEWSQDQGDLKENYFGRIVPQSASGLTDRSTDYSRFTQKYTVGANWYPLKKLNFGLQYYHKMRGNDYDHSVVRPPGGLLFKAYPGLITRQDFDTDDVNFRVTFRPLNNLTLVSRYDFQYSTIDTQGEGMPKDQTSEVTTHMFSETLTWVPFSKLYLQAGANLVFDEMETPVNDLAGAQQSLVATAKNDYWTANVTLGYTLNAKTDLQVSYLYYRANNFEDNSAISVPYGADSQEHGVTATLTRRITERMRWTLKYGYFNNREDASGGHNDYDAHLVYSSVQYLF